VLGVLASHDYDTGEETRTQPQATETAVGSTTGLQERPKWLNPLLRGTEASRTMMPQKQASCHKVPANGLPDASDSAWAQLNECTDTKMRSLYCFLPWVQSVSHCFKSSSASALAYTLSRLKTLARNREVAPVSCRIALRLPRSASKITVMWWTVGWFWCRTKALSSSRKTPEGVPPCT